MANKIPIVKDQVNVITLKCALDWHKAFKKQNKKGFAPGDIPRSIAVPYVDIEQIVNDFKKIPGTQVNGVRVYFIIKPGGPKGSPKISGILVPTTGPRPNPKGIFKDMIVKATLKKDAPKNPDCPGPGGNNVSARSVKPADEDDGYVSIYDVTRPCPDMCDPDSPLN